MTARAPFPRTFYVANVIELFERMAFYGMFVGLVLYLTNVVGFNDVETGFLLGNYRLLTALAPIPCGALADRITFRASLVLAFALYVFGYLALFLFPSKGLAVAALACSAIGGGFMKPVIAGTVVRTAPEGRESEGFALFYRMINAGSVVGKTLAYAVRVIVSLRYVMINSVVASAVALGLAAVAYREPERGRADKTSFGTTMRGYGVALKNVRFTAFLVLFAGFYFMADQFYVTFPKYVTRHIAKDAPLELITLINPALIALLQGIVTRLFARVHAVTAMIIGVLIGSTSMLVMGIAPGLLGACLSGAIFAMAEMVFSPRLYAHVASFAKPGQAGMYMGLAFVPAAIGYWVGGQASGPMIARYLPAEGPRAPFTVWATYAAIGVGCAATMTAYRIATRNAPAPSESASD
jgi:POT family proton-dependent oligopeptide transporter